MTRVVVEAEGLDDVEVDVSACDTVGDVCAAACRALALPGGGAWELVAAGGDGAPLAGGVDALEGHARVELRPGRAATAAARLQVWGVPMEGFEAALAARPEAFTALLEAGADARDVARALAEEKLFPHAAFLEFLKEVGGLWHPAAAYAVSYRLSRYGLCPAKADELLEAAGGGGARLPYVSVLPNVPSASPFAADLARPYVDACAAFDPARLPDGIPLVQWWAETAAATNGDPRVLTGIVERLMWHGADAGGALLAVAGARLLPMARVLLDPAEGARGRGAEVDLRCERSGRTALMLAAGAGDGELVALLLAHGADPTFADGDGVTALHTAASAHSPSAVPLLVAAGASLAARDAVEGATPLGWAARSGRYECIVALLAAGAAVRCCPGGDGAADDVYALLDDALRGSCMEWNEDGIRALMEHSGVLGCAPCAGALRGAGGAALRAACEEAPRRGVMLALLRAGVPADAECPDRGVTPLFSAAEGGNLCGAEALLKHGADVHATDVDGSTALHAAACGGGDPATDAAMVALLLAHGADANAASDLYSATPLIFAAQRGNGAVCRALLRGGADAARADDNGFTARAYAINEGFEDVRAALDAKGGA